MTLSSSEIWVLIGDFIKLGDERLQQLNGLLVVSFLPKFVDDSQEVVLVLHNNIFDFVNAMFERHYEEGEQVEQLFFYSFLVVGEVAELLHDVLQVFFVVHVEGREVEVGSFHVVGDALDILFVVLELFSAPDLLLQEVHTIFKSDRQYFVL